MIGATLTIRANNKTDRTDRRVYSIRFQSAQYADATDSAAFPRPARTPAPALRRPDRALPCRRGARSPFLAKRLPCTIEVDAEVGQDVRGEPAALAQHSHQEVAAADTGLPSGARLLGGELERLPRALSQPRELLGRERCARQIQPVLTLDRELNLSQV